MKIVRKVVALATAAVLAVTSIASLGSNSVKAATTEKITKEPLYIYSWNAELGEYVDYFKEKYPEYADLIVFEDAAMESNSLEYENYLVDMSSSTSGKAGIVALEEEFQVKNLLGSSLFVNLNSIGFGKNAYKNSYSYTKQMGTVNGKLKAMTWQASAGGFVYNRRIALEVFGTDDPKDIQELVKDWKSFNETAAKLKKAGYYMINGSDDAARALSDDYSSATVKKGKIKINEEIQTYIIEIKTLLDKGYTKNVMAWTPAWYDSMNSATSDVFGFFGCSWYIDWAMQDPNTHGYNLCEGPANYNWGGTYLAVSRNCKNKGLAKFFIEKMCTDADFMYEMAVDKQSFPNNTKAVAKLAKNGTLKFDNLDTQNAIDVFNSNAKNLNRKYASKYDWAIEVSFRNTLEYFLSLKNTRFTYNQFVKKFKALFSAEIGLE